MGDLAGSQLGVGTTIAGYQVEALIGRGGMGAVYRASDEGLGRKVALKMIAPELASDTRFRERFLRESRIAASLDHPHVVPIYQSGEEGGLLFIAMRYVEGTDLAKLLAAEGALEPRRALALLSQVAEALDAAHAKGLVHRDVKPSNVLIAESAGREHCYLGDFGLTKRTGSLSGVSVAGEIVGTLEYVAPEQITGDAPDARSDVYSLGCVLYECLTGQAPFPRATDVALLWAHVHEQPTRPSDIRPELSQALDSAVASALAKNPEGRYRSAGELIEACSVSGSSAAPTNGAMPPMILPRPLSSFVGRDAEFAEVRARLEGGARLLTLTGPGGSGKTRLALEVATALVPEYNAGVFWVGLSALRDPSLVTETIAQTLGAKDGLSEHIGEREMLLVIDNLEQVIDSAPELSSLLERCLNLTLLVTSRELLRVRGEVEYGVPPLVVEDAVELFCQRSGLVPSAEITELCARLDSLPLALELAAARARALSVAQILERLSGRLDLFKGDRDADPRQHTLRATIEWSYDLLDPDEQKLFTRLAVFVGGCTLEAAEAVVAADLDTLQSLVDKSLIRRIGERYRMLDTIHEYARVRLDESREAEEQHARHADYFLAFAEAVGGMHLHEGTQAFAIERLAEEMSNLRTAVDWSLDTSRYETVLRFGSALWFFWSVRGHTAEGRRVLEPAVMAADRETDEWLGGASAFSELERTFGNPEKARTLKEELVPLMRQRGETRMVAGTLADLGDLAIDDGDYGLARQLLEESLSLRSPDAHGGRGRTLASLGHLARREGNLELAEELLQEAADHQTAVDAHGAHTAWSLWALADVRHRRKDLTGAERAFRESLRISGALGDAASAADCLKGLAEVALERGQDDRAGRLREAAETLREADDAEAVQQRLDEAMVYALESID